MAVLRTPWTALAFHAGRSAGGLSAFAQTISRADPAGGAARRPLSPAACRCSPCRRCSCGRCCLPRFPLLVWLIDGSEAAPGAARTFRRSAPARAFAAGWWFGFGYFLLRAVLDRRGIPRRGREVRLADSLCHDPAAGGARTVHGARRRRRPAQVAARASRASSSWRSRSRWRNGCAATSSPVSRGTRLATR